MSDPHESIDQHSRRRQRYDGLNRARSLWNSPFCVPILFLFFFASLEFSRVNMIRQTIENATYEGCRRGIVPGATADNCRTAAQNVLNTVSTQDADITVTPGVITPETTQVTVSISVPVNSNSWVMPLFFDGKTIANSMTLRRERSVHNSVP